MKTPVEIAMSLRARLASLALDWVNRQIAYQISWQCVHPGRLLALNPNLLFR